MAVGTGGQATYFSADPAQRYAVEMRQLQVRWMGYLFGDNTVAPTNIAGFLVAVLTLTTVILAFEPLRLPAMEFLNLVLPIVTLTLGYLFGKNT